MIYQDLIDDILIEWGKRAKEETINLYFKTGLLGELRGSTVKSASITDEDYYKIDKIMSELRLINPDLAQVAGYIYITRDSYHIISELIKRSPSTISSYRKQIVEFVLNNLDN